MQYEFFAPRQIVFGSGRRREVGALARSLGRRALLVCGSRTLERMGALAEIASLLAAAGVDVVHQANISREPTVEDVDRTAALVRNAGKIDLVLALGGGSAIDLGKALAALATNRQGESVADYLEGVGRGLANSHPSLPILAMPTTGGTGSEATKNAVISSDNPPFKKSLRSEQLIPRIVLVDPELALSVPPTVTAWTGLDAITQLIESYLSRRAQPLPRALSLAALQSALPALVEAYCNGASLASRERMAHAALLSGMALANSGLGMAHGVAAALGVHCQVPHGLACAVMLPVALRTNRAVCEAGLAELAQPVTGQYFSDQAKAADAVIAKIEALCRELSIPERLAELGVERRQIPDLVRSSRGNSMSGNPRELSDDELTALLEGMV